MTGSMTFTISRFSSLLDLAPLRVEVSWLDLVALLSEPRRASCTQRTCSLSSCPHKRGACWSPALYVGADRSCRNVEAVSLLVFDMDRATDNQFDETRRRIAPLRYLVHSTHSDHDGSRYLRFVFPLSRPVSNLGVWTVFWNIVQPCLVPGADSGSADAGRIYYLPSCPSDRSYFIQANEGVLLDVNNILSTGNLSQLNTLHSIGSAS